MNIQRENTKTSELWKIGYDYANAYYKENGNLLIPVKYKIEDYRLGVWIASQRVAYKKGNLSQERKLLLDKINMIWDMKFYQWSEMYSKAKQYYEKYGDLNVPSKYVTKDGVKLGSWIAEQRKYYKKMDSERANSLFSEKKIEMLNDIEMIWDNAQNSVSTSFPEQSILYYAAKIKKNVCNRYLVDGVEIDLFFPDEKIGIEYDGDVWHKDVNKDQKKNLFCNAHGIHLIRIREPKCPILNDMKSTYILEDYSNITLSKTISSIFEMEFGISIDVDIDRDYLLIIEQYSINLRQKWKDIVVLLERYSLNNGNLLIPREYEKDGVKLGSIIHDLRKNRKKGKLMLSQKQIDKLDSLGMIWDTYESGWDVKYNQAKLFYDQKGILNPSEKSKSKEEKALYIWLNEQRKKYVKGVLSEEKIEKLEILDIDWSPISNRWNEMFAIAEAYKREKGNLLVPARLIYKNEKLGLWISTQRKKYIHPTQKSGKLSEKQISQLESIGMIWDVYEAEWLFMYQLCEAYYKENNDLRINRNYEVTGIKLGVWIGQQRVRYNRMDGSISDKHILLLNKLGMVWDEMHEKWMDYYKIARSYYEDLGSLDISQKIRYGNRALGKWIYNQKNAYKSGKLSNEQIELLEKLNICW